MTNPLADDEALGHLPFIDDPGHVAFLDGQRYVALRVAGAVHDEFRRRRSALSAQLQRLPISYPARPHVTLAGVAREAPIEDLLTLVREWARGVPPLELETARVSLFPPPAQIVVLELRKTPALHHAMSTLRQAIAEHGFVDLARVTPSDWVFHASLAYCSALGSTAWAQVAHRARGLSVSTASVVASEAEVIVYEQQIERCAGRIELTGLGRRAS